MSNRRQPNRQAPSVEEARLKTFNNNTQNIKKKPPPRPPPPDLSKMKSKSVWNLNQNIDSLLSNEWSPQVSPTTNRPSGGSVYSSFSSSTSSLASSKRSSEYESLPFNTTPSTSQNEQLPKNSNMPFFNLTWSAKIQQQVASRQNEQLSCVPQISMPTIIRPQTKNNMKSNAGKSTLQRNSSTSRDNSPPMPLGPPPSPPKDVTELTVPCAVATHNFSGLQTGDLSLEVNDIIYLLRRINADWLYGRVADKEGMFPQNFVDIQVPLPEDNEYVVALFEFRPQMESDLALIPGQKIKVLKIISNNWLYGESNGKTGQFPSNFVDRIPNI